jgi:phosphonate metabolism protein (transferase hexapeptide repeat family)
MSVRILSEEPTIDPTAKVRDSTLGKWTAVGARTTISESTMGDYSYVVNDSSIIYSEIGKFCSIAAQTRLNPGNHPMWRAALHHFSYRSVSYQLGEEDDHEFFEWRRSHRVVLGNDVWIGHGAVVLPGVKIGNGGAVGAGAVVRHDVEPYSIVVGVPAKPIRWRFAQPVREALQEIAWWDWSREAIKLALRDFRALSAEEFVEKYRSGAPQVSESDRTDTEPPSAP